MAARQVTPASWASSLLHRLGVPDSGQNRRAMVAWARAEGGHWNNSAHFNPLNTTQPEQGASAMNSVGVKSYKNWQQGLDATVQTLRNGRYGPILQALKHGDSARAVAAAVEKTPWGTGGGVLRTLGSSSGKLDGGVTIGSGGAGVPSTAGLMAASSGAQGVPQGSEGLMALLTALNQRPQPASSAGVQAPAFSAAPAMPAGAQMPVSGGGPAPKPDLNALLDAVRTVGGDVPQAPGEPASGRAEPAGGAGGARGQVVVESGADRPGVPTSRSILHVAEMVAAEAGRPLTVGTGSDHKRLTSSGNVSDHWTGRGVDIPAAGKQLTALGADALEALGIDRRKAAAMARRGGIYNVPYGKRRRVQVIVNAPDHYDHLHLGVSPR